MIITCPACSAQFRASAEQIGPKGRSVRCGKCAHEWRQDPLPEDDKAPSLAPVAVDGAAGGATDDAASGATGGAAGEAPGAPDDAATDEPAAQQSADDADRHEAVIAPPPITRIKTGGGRAKPQTGRRTSARLWAGWLVFLVLVGCLAAGLWFGRAAIVESVPRAAGLYALVGLGEPQLGDGLLLENVQSVRRLVGEERHLFVQGDVVNESDGPRKVPALKVVFIDTAGRELQAWTFEALAAELQPGESTSFQTSTSDLPEGAANLTVDFVLDP